MQISIVIPLLNEEESLHELHDWIVSVMTLNSLTYEIIFVDDGSSDRSWECVHSLAQKNTAVKGIRFMRNFGKSQALHAGFKKAAGDVVITMDADLQDNPEEIPGLFHKIMHDNYDLVSGWKKKRYDSILFKNLPSKLFNCAARKTSGIKLNDFNCGLKAYKKSVVKTIEVYGEMHRYIPVLAKHAGFSRIGEQIVKHQSRKYGKTKFGADRFVKGFLDLITLWFIQRFGKRPMHFFGLIGSLMLLIGFGFALFLGIDKLYIDTSGRLITQRPEFYIALITMVIGSQFFLAGFLGEIILRNGIQKQRYFIQETIS
jgi:glycosyltransferase involved in cell wall biosynthesis